MTQGRNENVKYKGYTFHIQTEDRGSRKPVVVSTLFYRGLIITEERVSYEHILSSSNLKESLYKIIKELHQKVIENLKSGVYDEKIKSLLTSDREIDAKKENSLLMFCFEHLLPSLKEQLGIELNNSELEQVRKEIESLGDRLDKDSYLQICSVIYQRIKKRCDKNDFKAFVKGYNFQIDSQRYSVSLNLREVFEKVVFDDLVEAIGYTLGSALMEKVFSEVHSSFLKKKEAFEIIMKRILNSGVVQKRTTEQWRNEKELLWREKYKNLISTLQSYV